MTYFEVCHLLHDILDKNATLVVIPFPKGLCGNADSSADSYDGEVLAFDKVVGSTSSEVQDFLDFTNSEGDLFI